MITILCLIGVFFFGVAARNFLIYSPSTFYAGVNCLAVGSGALILASAVHWLP